LAHKVGSVEKEILKACKVALNVVFD